MLSRQRRWQIKMTASGRCATCGAPAVTRTYCREHADKMTALKAPKIREWTYADPLRWKAHSALNKAVRAGRITRPDTCSACGARDDKINADHADYSKPFDVTWLCYRCHAKVTAARKQLLTTPPE